MKTFKIIAILVAAAFAGCASPYHADRGALLGGLTGAGAGALVGNATGNTAAGALIGAGLGTVTGAAIGSGLDEVEARNRAQIEAQLGKQLPIGGVNPADVVAMTRSGIDPDLIMNHVRTNGMAKKLDANDLIMLQQEGVAKSVITTMQTVGPPQPQVAAQAVPAGYYPAPQPVVVQEYYYAPPPPRMYHRWCGPPAPAMGFGFSYSQR